MAYKKTKKYLVGIDSDGAVFDSMKIKHTDSFIPAAVEVWGFDEQTAKRFTQIEEKINLYSMNRGINRFPGLLMTFEELGGTEGLENFRKYINSDYPFSNVGLEEYMQKNPFEMLDKAMEWSKLCDKLFLEGTKDLKPFAGVSKALNIMHTAADIMVVSAPHPAKAVQAAADHFGGSGGRDALGH